MPGVTVRSLAAMKARGEKIIALTAYDFYTARIEALAGVHLILVGDSMQMAVLGEETTLGASLEVLLAVARSVKRGAPDTLVLGDMPFGSYQESCTLAVRNAARFLSEAGVDGVKLEGGNPRMARRVKAVVDSGIPVMGHAGLLPQFVRMDGGYRVVRREGRDELLRQCDALVEAGVFSLVLEGVEEELAREVVERVPVPVIGIGAGRWVDGQILVVSDVLGLDPGFNPKFVRKYADLHGTILTALRRYVEEVASGAF
ncbi:MAG TPA: 3-methyl-2-oxobutanoate hydroxymethyltransferase, partial [Synergistaceae bacterium]|nr:3-methyl-2-oxobutanoate hydroxymethyltransferase [Synergistaceae bacterium]